MRSRAVFSASAAAAAVPGATLDDHGELRADHHLEGGAESEGFERDLEKKKMMMKKSKKIAAVQVQALKATGRTPVWRRLGGRAGTMRQRSIRRLRH